MRKLRKISYYRVIVFRSVREKKKKTTGIEVFVRRAHYGKIVFLESRIRSLQINIKESRKCSKLIIYTGKHILRMTFEAR